MGPWATQALDWLRLGGFNSKWPAGNTQFSLRTEGGMGILVHQADQAVAAKVERDMAQFPEPEHGPEQAPGHGQEGDWPAFGPRDFLENLPKHPRLLMRNGDWHSWRDNRCFGHPADETREVLVMDEILDLRAAPEQRQHAGLLDLAHQPTKHPCGRVAVDQTWPDH